MDWWIGFMGFWVTLISIGGVVLGYANLYKEGIDALLQKVKEIEKG